MEAGVIARVVALASRTGPEGLQRAAGSVCPPSISISFQTFVDHGASLGSPYECVLYCLLVLKWSTMALDSKGEILNVEISEAWTPADS